MPVFPLLVIEHEHQSRYCQKVKKVDADGKSHQKAYEHDPAVRIRLIRLIIPFGHRPEHKGCHKRGHGIHFALHCREPESVAEAVCKGSHSG